MTSNLDKILSDIKKRTAEDIKRIEKEQEEKRKLWMSGRN
jgi:hypothetical protein